MDAFVVTATSVGKGMLGAAGVCTPLEGSALIWAMSPVIVGGTGTGTGVTGGVVTGGVVTGGEITGGVVIGGVVGVLGVEGVLGVDGVLGVEGVDGVEPVPPFFVGADAVRGVRAGAPVRRTAGPFATAG
jgi:hypothetical protein